MRKLVKWFIHYAYRPWAIWYIKSDREYHYKGLSISVPTGVFHPGLFFSSKMLASYLESLDIIELKALELGSGSGMISCVMSRLGADVVAIDINPNAVEAVKKNSESNRLSIETIESDLFDNLDERIFDLIVINPPYYARKPETMTQRAWFAGENLEYFKKLFNQLGNHINSSTMVIMSASEDVNMAKIQEIATSNSFEISEIFRRRIWMEWNYIYKIIKTD